VYSSTALELFWKRSTGASGTRYEVWRDGLLLATTQAVSYYDDQLEGDRRISYEIVAIDASAQRSVPAAIVVQTAGMDSTEGVSPPAAQTDSSQQTLASLLPDRDLVFGEDISTFPQPTLRDDEGSLVWVYDIVDDQLSSERIEPPLSHQRAWQRFADLIPALRRSRLLQVKFVIGQGSAAGSTATMYYVFADKAGQGAGTLTLYDSLTSAYGNEPLPDTDRFRGLEYIYIHEYAHLLSNEQAAIPAPGTIQNAPQGAALWPPSLGVPAESVYGRFILRFWGKELVSLWHSTRAEDFAGVAQARYPERFVTLYAASNYNEDFAESFSHFVMGDDKPESGSYPGSETILFFWGEPDLVSLRDEIRARLLTAR
jgi:hypothetical protein